jgi:hypothetical protein
MHINININFMGLILCFIMRLIFSIVDQYASIYLFRVKIFV